MAVQANNLLFCIVISFNIRNGRLSHSLCFMLHNQCHHVVTTEPIHSTKNERASVFSSIVIETNGPYLKYRILGGNGRQVGSVHDQLLGARNVGGDHQGRLKMTSSTITKTQWCDVIKETGRFNIYSASANFSFRCKWPLSIHRFHKSEKSLIPSCGFHNKIYSFCEAILGVPFSFLNLELTLEH